MESTKDAPAVQNKYFGSLVKSEKPKLSKYFNHLLEEKGDLAPGGNLTLKIIKGNLMRETEILGSMDPFIKIEFNGKTYKT